MLELGKDIEEKLLKIYADNGVMLEGNIIKLIKPLQFF